MSFLNLDQYKQHHKFYPREISKTYSASCHSCMADQIKDNKNYRNACMYSKYTCDTPVILTTSFGSDTLQQMEMNFVICRN